MANRPMTKLSAAPGFWVSALRWFASFINSWIHFFPLLLVCAFSRPLAYRIYRNWVRVACRIFGVTYSLRDDNQGEVGPAPHLYVWLNQSNIAEGLICMMCLPPILVVINVEYALLPFFGCARALLGDPVIVRQWKWQAKRGIERAMGRLKGGESGMISIEGARSADGQLLPYKKGPLVLAIGAQATILPMMIHGGREVLPPGTWRLRPGHIEIHLLKAMPTRGLSLDARDAMVEQLRSAAQNELARRADAGLSPGA